MKKVILSVMMFMFVCGSFVANAQDPVKPEKPTTEKNETPSEEKEQKSEESTEEAPAQEEKAPAETAE